MVDVVVMFSELMLCDIGIVIVIFVFLSVLCDKLLFFVFSSSVMCGGGLVVKVLSVMVVLLSVSVVIVNFVLCSWDVLFGYLVILVYGICSMVFML